MISYNLTRTTVMSFLPKSLEEAVLCLSVLAFTPALAAVDDENAANAFLECAAIQDDARRLECFDRAAAGPQPTEVLSETAEIPQAEPAVVESAAVPAVAATVTAATVTETVAETVMESEVAPESSAINEFGMNAAVEAQSTDSSRPDKLTEISATVTHVRKRGYGELVVTLENGQVWTEKVKESGFRIKEGEMVTIRQGTLGGYRMIGRSNRSSQVVRVK